MTNSQKIANSISVIAILATAWLLLRKRDTSGESASQSTVSTYPNPSGATRGLKNNNPLNIEYRAGTNWQGEIIPSGDSRFAQFTTMAYGYRAAFKTLNTYITKYGLTTLQQIINRWDAGNQNYVSTICKWTGWSPDKEINPNNKSELLVLVYQMSRMENGVIPSLSDIKAGYNLYRA